VIRVTGQTTTIFFATADSPGKGLCSGLTGNGGRCGGDTEECPD
jgi:hypothetical protein